MGKRTAREVLLIEDDRAIATVITAALEDEGFAITHCASIAERDRLLAQRRFDVMLTDVILEDGDGLDGLAAAREAAGDLPVIVLSAQNTLDTAVRASESEAFEYFPKPFDLDELVHAVKQAASARGAGTPDEPGAAVETERMPLVGRSPAMQSVYRMITRVLRNDLTVLITGESGTGKELVAEAIHQLGSRRTGPFVAVNAAAIPSDLIESELFGHEKGAFTGAVAQAIGKFEQAEGGTLFLDEIGDMPIEAQTRLLRVLQEGEFTPVGARRHVKARARVIAATHQDLRARVRDGRFREDLYYRLNVVPLHVPPLRERAEDIPALVQHFLRQSKALKVVEPAAIAVMQAHGWPGNVRELENAVRRLAALHTEDVIDAEAVRMALQASSMSVMTDGVALSAPGDISSTIADILAADASLMAGTDVYDRIIRLVEKPLIARMLAMTGGNQIKAAELLGLNRNTLRKKITELDIDVKKGGRS